jgi:hypothetical protein
MLKIIREEYNKLLKCRLTYQGGNTWQIHPAEYKDGTLVSKKGIIVRGEDESLRKFLVNLKVKDTDSEPASFRKMSYADMIRLSKESKGFDMWVYTSRWNTFAGNNGIIEV